MLKFIVLFFAAFAVFSPLFLIGIRKYTGRKARRALGANPATISTRLRRGRAQLKTLLEQEGYR